MLRTLRVVLAIGFLFTSIPLLASADDDKDQLVDNPLYIGWAGHKPGASSTLLEKTTFSDDKNQAHDQKIITYSLLSVSADKVVVRAVVSEQELLGTVESAPTKHTYPAKLKKSYLAIAAPELNSMKGEETIKWKGKEMKCKTMYGSYKKDGEAVEFKAWFNETIPGGVVKRIRTLKVVKEEKITTTTTLQSYRAGKGK